jgi:hypothetical protein
LREITSGEELAVAVEGILKECGRSVRVLV